MSERVVPTRALLRLASTTTADGGPIGWWTLGHGPDLVVVHGAMQSGRSQWDLAALLADRHTVHLMDRRGRGASAESALGPRAMRRRTRSATSPRCSARRAPATCSA